MTEYRTTLLITSPVPWISAGSQTFCTCANGMMAGLNLAVSGTTSMTYCATGGPLPTVAAIVVAVEAVYSRISNWSRHGRGTGPTFLGYAKVPYRPGAPKWASDLYPAAPCSNPESPDSSCWAALELDQ